MHPPSSLRDALRHLIPSLLQCLLAWALQSATQSFLCDLTPVGTGLPAMVCMRKCPLTNAGWPLQGAQVS